MFPFLTSSTFDTGVSTKGNSMIPKSRRRSSCSFQIHDRTSAALRNGIRPPKLHGPMSICPKVWEFMGLNGYSSFLLVLFMMSFYSVYLPFPGSSRITHGSRIGPGWWWSTDRGVDIASLRPFVMVDVSGMGWPFWHLVSEFLESLEQKNRLSISDYHLGLSENRVYSQL